MRSIGCRKKPGWPVKRGFDPIRYQAEPVESEGVDLIIERAMAGSAAKPSWVAGLGAATDIASAMLQEPRIIDRFVVFRHFRTRWPEKRWNFNVFGDVRAARLVFHSPCPFVLFDTGTYLTLPMEESEAKLAPCGELGRCLHEIRLTDPAFREPTKGLFDLGDIAALLDPSLACWHETD